MQKMKLMGRKINIRPVATGKYRGTFLLPSEGCFVVHLNPCESALYRLFLAHPEGIASENLLSHWDELSRIYSQESLFDESSRQEDVLEALCSESRHNFYSTISRIKSKFVCTFGARKAAGYYIKRYPDGLYRTKAVLITMNAAPLRAHTPSRISGQSP